MISSYMPSKPSYNRRRSLSDPLSKALLPPPNESPFDRERRLRDEVEAKKVSDDIDVQLQKEGAMRKKKKEIKILLLGQSESGKSTTLKQFQLMHTPAAFHAERIAWRFVIYLNLVRSIRRILEALLLAPLDPSAIPSSLPSDFLGPGYYDDTPGSVSDRMMSHFQNYAKRLKPLVSLEERLIRQLSCPEDGEDEATHLGPPPPVTIADHPYSSSARQQPIPSPAPPLPSKGRTSSPISPITSPGSKEPFFRTNSNWKKSFSLGAKVNVRRPKSAHTREVAGWWEDPDDPVHVLNACASGEWGMIALWRDPEVRATLSRRRVRMEESSGFYLDEIQRITAKRYIPIDDDVLKARLKTIGVVEHDFNISSGKAPGVDWKIYDVGGSRNQRTAWAPYFEDVNAIIFLAPISAFDQVLAEDARVNRLEDSLLLWRSVVSNKLLENVNIILFLNKCDLLKAKLNAGVQLNYHMISYGDRPNDYDSVSTYFRNKFGALHQAHTPNKERELYIHLTSVTDKRKTSTIIANVRDIILRDNLKTSRLI